MLHFRWAAQAQRPHMRDQVTLPEAGSSPGQDEVCAHLCADLWGVVGVAQLRGDVQPATQQGMCRVALLTPPACCQLCVMRMCGTAATPCPTCRVSWSLPQLLCDQEPVYTTKPHSLELLAVFNHRVPQLDAGHAALLENRACQQRLQGRVQRLAHVLQQNGLAWIWAGGHTRSVLLGATECALAAVPEWMVLPVQGPHDGVAPTTSAPLTELDCVLQRAQESGVALLNGQEAGLLLQGTDPLVG